MGIFRSYCSRPVSGQAEVRPLADRRRVEDRMAVMGASCIAGHSLGGIARQISRGYQTQAQCRPVRCRRQADTSAIFGHLRNQRPGYKSVTR
jgi:hypothetical protein